MTKTKIKIPDEPALRERLDRECDEASHVQLCRYALGLAAHILALTHDPHPDHPTLQEGFRICGQWQKGLASVQEVRRCGFQIHQMARATGDAIARAAWRVAGHAVATAHMREHALVASDYAVKVVSLLHPDSLDEVRKERLWQIRHLAEIGKSPEGT